MQIYINVFLLWIRSLLFEVGLCRSTMTCTDKYVYICCCSLDRYECCCILDIYNAVSFQEGFCLEYTVWILRQILILAVHERHLQCFSLSTRKHAMDFQETHNELVDGLKLSLVTVGSLFCFSLRASLCLYNLFSHLDVSFHFVWLYIW